MSSLLLRIVSIADDATDDDDAHLRKRVGVVAGCVTVFAPLTLPIQAQGQPLSFVVAIAMSAFSLLNLVVLARTRRFERFVTGLLVSGAIFVPTATWIGGGLTGSTNGLVWGFLGPGYAIMALGPRLAKRWFVVFIAMVAVMVVTDPFVHSAAPAQSPLVALAQTANGVAPLTIVFVLLLYTDFRRRAAEARADELLTNAIPKAIAARLRRGESRIAESYPETTVVFSDIAGFTPWAQRTEPARVVELLDELFTQLDELATVHGVEKIKTIGDSYMAVCGAPEPRTDHAAAAVAFAEAMLAAVGQWSGSNDLRLGLRVGLASGSVVAGVIGQKRILFDLWGETVNLAARMESSGVPGSIQLAESTWSRLPDQSGFARREVDVKGLGMMTTYMLEPRASHGG